MVEVQTQADHYSVFLLHGDEDVLWVEEHLAVPLEDEAGLRPHFMKWHSIAGKSTQEAMQDGFDKSECCAVCLGKGGLGGLQKMMQEAATKRKSKVPGYRLIPVLLPEYDSETLPDLLDGLGCVDFRSNKDPEEQFHLLVCGIKNIAPGRWRPKVKTGEPSAESQSKDVKDRYAEELVRCIKLAEVGEKNGLPKEEAAAFRRAVLDNLYDEIKQGFSISDVSVRGSRIEGA